MHLGDDGLAFYHFENVASAKLFKDEYRATLDALSLTPEQVQKLVAEANVAFYLNVRLFEELDVMASVPGAAVRPLQDALAFAEVPEIAEHAFYNKSNASEKCPFADLSKQTATSKAVGVLGVSAAIAQSAVHSGGQCPWPFIFMHDPVKGLQDWKTWALLGITLTYIWSLIVVEQ
jgi:hypothetical protein